MNGTRDIDDAAASDPGGTFDPQAAASLLDQTTRQARRELDLTSPLLSLIGATTALVALGAVWLSVRTQHPYKGPTAAGLGVMYGILACWIATVVVFQKRALAGRSGRSVRQQRGYAAAVVMALVAAAFQAASEAWPAFGVAIAVICVATGSAFAGPRGVWLSNGIGLAVVVLGYGAAQAWPRRQ
jgi:hypothetical protein